MFLRRQAVLTLAIFLGPGLSWAADYKDWLPYIPNQLDGLKAETKGQGMNMNTGNGSMSKFDQMYRSGKKQITISITHTQNSSGQTPSEKPREQLNMETSEVLMKTIKINGFDAFYTYNKGDNNVLIYVYLKGEAMMMFTSTGIGVKGDQYYIDLISKFNLKKINATL